MGSLSYRLSVEELAFALGMLGGAEGASGFLRTVLGDRSQAELEGRLMAACHSLIARDLLKFDLQTQSKELDGNLAALVGILLQSDFSIRCSRSTVNGELLCTYFFRGRDTVEHRIVQEIISSVRLLRPPQAAAASSLDFFGLAKGTAGTTGPVGTIPVSLLEQLREQAASAREDHLTPPLMAAGISAPLADRLAEDLLATEYRGSVIRIDNRNGQMVSNKGFLILKGHERYWLLEILEQQEPLVRVFRGSASQYRHLYADLLAGK